MLRVWNSIPGRVLWRNNVGGIQKGNRYVSFGLGGAGSADLIGIDGGRFVAIEVKARGQKPRPNQLAFLRAVHDCGGVAKVATQNEHGKIVELPAQQFF